MDRIELITARCIKGEFIPPPDKSISHRAVFFSSIADGKSLIRNFLMAGDTLSTVSAFRALGVTIEERAGEIIIYGSGLRNLREPEGIIDCGNSGTTMRLLSGVLSGNPFFSVLSGDESLRKRPMHRVIVPLREMGAEIMGRDKDRYPPLAIKGKDLRPIKYMLPVASAQLKSSVMIAGLYCEGQTEITEPLPSRDHSERMLSAFGANIKVDGLKVIVRGGAKLQGIETVVPGDFSSAAFFVAAALLIRGSDIVVRSVGINPTRIGLVNVLKRMGAAVVIENIREVSGEPVADIRCGYCDELKAIDIKGDEMPLLIDEFPILCVVASRAEGVTSITGAEELRVKESDRIKAMATELRKFGVEIEEYPGGLAIKGKAKLKGCETESYGDHRVAMSLAVAAMIAEGKTIINHASCVDISFPGFWGELGRLTCNG